MLKSENVNRYPLVKSVAESFVYENFEEVKKWEVHFEHGQFWLMVETEDFYSTYSAIDSGCEMCKGCADKCLNCGSESGLSFELLEENEF